MCKNAVICSNASNTYRNHDYKSYKCPQEAKDEAVTKKSYNAK